MLNVAGNIEQTLEGDVCCGVKKRKGQVRGVGSGWGSLPLSGRVVPTETLTVLG